MCKKEFSYKNLQQFPILKRLTDDVLERLYSMGKIVECEAGVLLCREGQSADQIFWFIDGQVKTFVSSHDGEETVIDILSRKQKIGLVEVCGGSDFTVSAQALEPSIYFTLDKEKFLEFLDQSPDLQISVLANISAEMRGNVKEINDLKLKNTAKRLGTYLLAQVDEETGASEIELSFGKRLLAARLAMKPESLSRALQKLKPIGVTSSRSAIFIQDLDRLYEFCGEDELDLEEAVSE